MIVEPLSAANLDGFHALFEAASCACFCRYWHFAGTKNDWLDRCAHRAEESFVEQAEAVRRSDPSALGLVARADDAIVGWMKIAPVAAVPKLRSLPVYRSVPLVAGAEAATYAVGCFLIHPRSRRRGVARALLRGAEGHVRAWGGRVIEGYPRRSSEPLHDEEAFQGPEAIFRELGYEEVAGTGDSASWPYPVYRKVL
ncbi:MAG: GNAT family N-acetyltransferase [Labilithrix sp.]|nr:GNAT family N-acetyltransferase [Labilithrix sp.]